MRGWPVKAAVRTGFYRIRLVTFCKDILSKVRRLLLCAARPKYVRRQEGRRGGECFQCGRCCKLVFKCPFLGGTEENPQCMIYDHRPKPCAAFPIDERDLQDVGYLCGYEFGSSGSPRLIHPHFS